MRISVSRISLPARRRTRLVAGGGAVALTVAVVVGVAAPSGGPAPAAAGGGAPTAEAERRDLAATVTVDGRLEHTDTRAAYWQQAAPPPAAGEPGRGAGSRPTATGGPILTGDGGASRTPRAGVPDGSASRSGDGDQSPGGGTSGPPTSTTAPSGSSSTTSTTAPSTTTSSTTTSTTTPSTTTTSTTAPSTTTSSTSTSSTTTAPCASGAGTGGAPGTTVPACPVAVPVAYAAPAAGGQEPGPGERSTLTSVAAAGQRVEPGDVLFSVDGRPSVLLTGSEPAFRALHEGVDDGADVAQLEENLAALGYGGPDLTVDDEFDAATTAAVAAWQEDLGVEPTGRVELGDVVFSSAPATVAAAHADVGDAVSPGGHVLDLTGDTVLAVGSIPARRRGEVGEGSPVQVTLADGTTVSGTVRAVGGETTRPEEAALTDSTVEVTVQLDATDSDAARAGADAALAVTTDTRRAALTVPVAAIVDGGDGRPAVRVPAGGTDDDGEAGAGTAVTVELEPGLAAGGYVEVAGGSLAEGDVVLLPGSAPEP